VSDWQSLEQAARKTEAETVAGIEAMGYSAQDAASKVDVTDAHRVAAEQSRVITAAHKAFASGSLSGAQANQLLEDLGVAEWARTQILITWGVQVTFGV
jgi:hypothetical protein